jgi:cytochrome c oxidase subunit 4
MTTSKITPRRTYFFVFLALIAMLAGTIAMSFYDLGVWNTVVGLVFAAAKATLVILFFMHVRHSSQLTRIFVMAGFIWLAILIGLTLSDYLTRLT